MKATPTIIVGAVVVLIGIGAITLTLLSFISGQVNTQSPHLTSLLGLIGTSVVAFLALLRIEQTRHDLRNGVVKRQIKRALEERAEEVQNGERDDRQ